ncbi:MAG: (d)CMP kinase [Bacteroidales bacterium]|nr:(d)CMP kinase [Bacteroidales bacterium]MCI1784592.1 (d)CMP kinase [Bacteroidales bacterium]
MPDIIIAIDGYSSTGKSSFAKLIAHEFSFMYLDSGALYRAITYLTVNEGLIDKDGQIDSVNLKKRLEVSDIHFSYSPLGSKTFIGETCIEDKIRTLSVSDYVSPVAALPFVRDYVDGRLKEFGKKRRIVMDGRDIGTTVFPDAEIKIFMTADPEIRAQRRFDELVSKGSNPIFDDVMNNLRERDYIDSHRETSPLVKADDAFILDNSDMSVREELFWLKGLIQGKLDILQ